MATKKDKSLSTRNEAAGKRPWPSLPRNLLNSPARKPNLPRQIIYPGPTKSFATPMKRCNSSRHPRYTQLQDLQLSEWRSLSKTLPHFLNIYFRTGIYWGWYYDHKSPPQFWDDEARHFIGISQGLLVKRGPSPSYLEVYEVSTRVHWFLPPWDVNLPFRFVTLSELDCVIVLTGISSPAFLVNRHNHVWAKHDCTTADPYDAKNEFMKFTNIIGFGGKLYALSLQGALAVIEDIDLQFVITRVGKSRAVPCTSARYFKEYLLESNGEILLVFLLYRKTLLVVDGVEVFRLRLDDRDWIRIESLEERALFLESECCIWVDSRQVGCRGNCVYFYEGETKGWCMFDIETGCVSNGKPWFEE